MIFVTVGTHEQQFNRLIKELDSLRLSGRLQEDIFIQTGFSDYIPKACSYKKMLTYQEMNEYAKNADIIITHGGPASIFLAYSYDKIPIVVPRQKKYNEHIDNHQLLFSRRLSDERKIILIEEIETLSKVIEDYAYLQGEFSQGLSKNNKKFVETFENILKSII